MARCWPALLVLAFGFVFAATAHNTTAIPAQQPAAEDLVTEDAEKDPTDPTLATVTEGRLRGVEERAIDGKLFYSYRGVPYAKPPVGKHRFQPSEPLGAWEGVRDAIQDPPRCPQMDADTLIFAKPFQLLGEEDCLYLNVFSPMPELSPTDQLLPVMVFIHGGAYFFGYAGQYPPYTLMTKDIVLVVIQYRLGTLGFLSTEDDTAPGNMGILDQTMALKWIQKNVASFGGNPLKITLVGEDSGASSAHLQVLSHTSLGFFHRAILMSGNALTSWSMGSHHRNCAYFIAKVAQCHTWAGEAEAANCDATEGGPEAHNNCLVEQMSSGQIMKCLNDAPLELITESAIWFIRFNFYPLMMGPRVHKNLMMQNPAKLVKEGRFKKVDLMFGTTKHDGALVTMGIFSSEGLRSAMRFKFEKMGPLSLDFEDGDIAILNQTISLYDHYVGSNDFELNTADALTQLYTDRLAWYPTDVAVQFHAADPISISKKKKVYAYEFSHRGKSSFIDRYPADIGEKWVAHGDDLIYLFGALKSDSTFGGPLEDEQDKKMSEVMVKMWINFATNGVPTDSADPFDWVPNTKDKSEVLVIDTNPRMKERKNVERQFWRQLPLQLNLVLFPNSVSNLTKVETTPTKVVEHSTKVADAQKDEL